MGWTCRRPGCHREAAASIGYDPVACQVWLDPLGAGRDGQHLCEGHAERLHAPRGWVVVDRRGHQSSIVARAPSPTAPDRSAPPRRPARAPRRWGQLQEPRLEFTAGPLGAPPAPVAEEPPAVLDDDDADDADVADDAAPGDLGELLRPTSPLLSRAFESVAPRRSALLPDPATDDPAAAPGG